jgi:hypothetical protein
MPEASIRNEQVIETAVSGPDGANRLFSCTGQADVYMYMAPEQTAVETWTFLIGPELPRPRFHRAIASGLVVGYAHYVDDPAANGWYGMTIDSVEADWDDESGRTEMRMELRVSTGPGARLTVSRLGFSATVLGELPSD